MNQVRLLLFEPVGQAPDQSQRRKPLFADGPVQVVCATGPDAITERTIGGDDGTAMPVFLQVLAKFYRNQFGPAQVQRNKGLDNMH